MTTISELIPDARILVSLPPEKVGRALMICARSQMQNAMFVPSSVTIGPHEAGYASPNLGREVQVALAEAWHWLELNMLIMPEPGVNGRNGWKIFTRRGEALLDHEAEFQAFTHASKFPRELLHPTLGDDVWLELAQGKHS